MDFIKKVFNFINLSAIFTISILGIRLFFGQFNALSKQSNLSYIDIYIKSNIPALTIIILIAGITAIAIKAFSNWKFKFWIKINLCINVLLLAVFGICTFFYLSSVGVKLILAPLIIVYLALYIAYRSMLNSGYKIDIVYTEAEEGYK